MARKSLKVHKNTNGTPVSRLVYNSRTQYRASKNADDPTIVYNEDKINTNQETWWTHVQDALTVGLLRRGSTGRLYIQLV